MAIVESGFAAIGVIASPIPFLCIVDNDGTTVKTKKQNIMNNAIITLSKVFAAIILTFSLASCTWDEYDTNQLDCSVKITLAEPSSGKTEADVQVDRVRYFVYESTGKSWTLRDEMTGETAIRPDGTADLNITLTHDNLYSIIFWADCRPDANEDERFILDPEKATVTMNTTRCKANDPKSDAFFAVTPVRGGVPGVSVILWHALAKVNVMTKAMPAEATESSITMSHVPVAFNFMAYDVTDDRCDINFASNSCTGNPEIVSGMDTMAYAYLFAPADRMKDSAVSVSLNNSTRSELYSAHFDNVPLQRNRKTDVECKF